MTVKPAPIRDELIEVIHGVSLLSSKTWVPWLQSLIKSINNIVSQADIEVVGDTNGLILESPNGTRWRLQVSNAGALTITSL